MCKVSTYCTAKCCQLIIQHYH
ncbi:hypothetical protein LSH36_119g08093 [Paralvinella palmiformis]|uniref:Uncharacterized protein n=1 Tax=Paralvinella palmiformis TaxID=53620 RepID=A0AAD9JZF2_9ANNE|nr:hypothetical protein LSH36_119g08093 [Paralvinella palmiformis]